MGKRRGQNPEFLAHVGKGRKKGVPNKLTKYLPIARKLGNQAIMEKAAVLEKLSSQARAEEPWRQKKRLMKPPKGEPALVVVEEEYAPGEAASRLLDHYKPVPDASPTITPPILLQVPPAELAARYKALLAGGNGTRKAESRPTPQAGHLRRPPNHQ
jgi:hypothetical protein